MPQHGMLSHSELNSLQPGQRLYLSSFVKYLQSANAVTTLIPRYIFDREMYFDRLDHSRIIVRGVGEVEYYCLSTQPQVAEDYDLLRFEDSVYTGKEVLPSPFFHIYCVFTLEREARYFISGEHRLYNSACMKLEKELDSLREIRGYFPFRFHRPQLTEEPQYTILRHRI